MECLKVETLDLKQCTGELFNTIREAIPIHGVVCVKNQSLSVTELIGLTRAMGEPVYLPAALRFNNTENEFPEVARVSNILPSGELLHNHSAAEYWHSDGDFWQPGRNFIFNFLYAEIVPAEGGGTAFADLRLAYQSLDTEIQNKISELEVVVSCDEIPDFKDTNPQDRQPDARHKIKHTHPETGLTGLYFGHAFANIDGISKSESDEIMAELNRAIENPANQYEHQWEVGDVLVWDNTSVMHRSMGNYKNFPRLLYRTQAFMEPLAKSNTLQRSVFTGTSLPAKPTAA